MPSTNMALPDTAIVYPGMCLLEATDLSEGRSTTRPFEIFGAPWIDGWKFVAELNRYNLPGVVFRPLEFQPTFQKHAGYEKMPFDIMVGNDWIRNTGGHPGR